MKQFNVAVGLLILLYGNAVALWALSVGPDPYMAGGLGFMDGAIFALLGAFILLGERNR